MNISTRNNLIKEIDNYFKDYKKFKMPSFRKSTKESNFFHKNSSRIYKLFNLKNKTSEQYNQLNELILCSYFSSKTVIKSIKKINNFSYDKKKINIINLFDSNKKRIFKNLTSNDK